MIAAIDTGTETASVKHLFEFKSLTVGGLVKKILESKKEYAQTEQKQSQAKTKIDKSSMNDATRHKEKEMVKKEVCHLMGLSSLFKHSTRVSSGVEEWSLFVSFFLLCILLPI